MERRHFVGLIGPTGAGKTPVAVALLRGATTYDVLTRGGVCVQRGRTLTVREVALPFTTAKRRYVLVDTPGMPPFFRIACVALSLIDDAIWIVDGDTSVTPHGRMLLRAAKGMGVRRVVVFVPRASADPLVRELADEEIRAEARAAGFADSPVVYEDVGALVSVLDELPDVTHDASAALSLPVQRVYRRHFNDAVAVGRIVRGRVRVGDDVELVGLSRKNGVCRVEELQMFGERIDEATAGDLVAARFARTEPYKGWAPYYEDIVVVERGKHIVAPGSVSASRAFSCEVDLVATGHGGRRTPFATGFAPQFLLRTADVTGRCDLGGGRAEPGERVRMQVSLHEPAVVEDGMPFLVLGETAAARGLVGIGSVIALSEAQSPRSTDSGH